MFCKIPLDADLSNTSYRCKKEVEDAIYIEYNEGYAGQDWEEIDEVTMREIAPEWFETIIPIPTQFDRIEAALNAMTADSVTEESINNAILEGVNEV